MNIHSAAVLKNANLHAPTVSTCPRYKCCLEPLQVLGGCEERIIISVAPEQLPGAYPRFN